MHGNLKKKKEIEREQNKALFGYQEKMLSEKLSNKGKKLRNYNPTKG